jgi:DNA-binding transcriptional LysR family regulator
MEVRHLRSFLTVSKELHFRRAAELLHLSQPSLSQQIHQLEDELGVQLFKRSKRKVELTEAGVALMGRAQRIIEEIDATSKHIREIADGRAGTFSIGFISTAVVGVLPKITRLFQAKYASVDLQLHECEPDQQVDDIIRGKLDVGLMHAQLEGGNLASMVIQRDKFVIALPSDLKARGPVDLRKFQNYTAIIPSPFSMHGFSEHVHLAYQLAGVVPSKVLSTRLIMIGIHLVAAGLGVAVVPASFTSVKVEGVVYRPLRFQPPRAELLAVWRRDDQSVLLRRFLEVLKEGSNC